VPVNTNEQYFSHVLLPITGLLVMKFILRPADIARMFQNFSLSCDISLSKNYVRQGEQSEKSTGAVFHETRDIYNVQTALSWTGESQSSSI